MMRLIATGVAIFIATSLAPFGRCPAQAQQELVVGDTDPLRLSVQLQAPQGLYPGIVAVERFSEQGGWSKHCSGTLLKRDWVATQAYCVLDPRGNGSSPLRASDLRILYGNVDLDKASSAEIESVIVHEDYAARPTPSNSIALLKLKAEIPVLPSIVARDDIRALTDGGREGGSAVTVGWGSFFSAEPADRLHRQRHLSVRAISATACEAAFPGLIRPGMVCAYSAFKGIDVCAGFAGGPLMLPDARGRFKALGMVSWAEGCAKPNRPTVYTHLTHYLPWIEARIGALPADEPAPPSARASQKPAAAPKAEGAISPRIVGPDANIAPAGLFRYMVSIGEAKKNQALGHLCGGALIAKRYVLTAAHCVVDGNGVAVAPETLQLKVDTEMLSSGGVYLKPKRIIVHDRYKVEPLGDTKFDIALIEVTGDAPSDIVPPPLADFATEQSLLGPEGDDPRDVVVVGWGKDAFSRYGKISNYLHWTTLQVIRRAECNLPRSYAGRIDGNVYCAGRQEVDSCQGDSGGPLLTTDKDLNFVLVGVVSWGEGCGKSYKPGVYTRIPAFREWVTRNAN